MTLRGKPFLTVGLFGLCGLFGLFLGAGYAQQPPARRPVNAPAPAPVPVPPQAQAMLPPATSPVSPTLTLDRAEAIALKNHPQIQYARYNALASDQIVREIRSAYYPTVFGSITGSGAGHD
ncbi:MAG: hypothetical protein ACRD2O_18305, partial [Terriglobia bacterium]